MRWLKNLLSKPSERSVETRTCTVSFTNMSDYGVIAGTMSVDDLPLFMNRFFDTHEQAIRSNAGTISQIIGDNIMAVWAADDSAQAACMSALDQCKIMREFDTWAEAHGYPSPKFRIGINTGPMHVNKGPRPNQVAVLGDAVNLASRLDQLNKSYGTRILISEFTREGLDASLIVRPVDVVRIKGKEKSVTLFELIGRVAEANDELRVFFDEYNAAFSKYVDGDFEEALRGFETAMSRRPEDIATDMFIARCRSFVECPPNELWAGKH